MSYTADELKGAGHLLKNPMLGGGTYTFTLYRPKNQTGVSQNLSGSGYFTFETVRDAKGFYPQGTLPLALGTKINISGSNTLVESPYVFSYELNTNSNTPMTSSFEFIPSVDVPISGAYLRATGDYDMYISPETEACGIPTTYSSGPNYPTVLESVLGSGTGTVTLTTDPRATIPDRWRVQWDSSIVIDTGYISPSGNYGFGGTSRNSFNNSLIGRIAPEGGTYPLTPGGTFPNVIEPDGYPRVNITPRGTQYTFNKNNATSSAIVRVYGPTTGTLWDSTLSCPV
ncbi:MAG: hypothetical protein K0U52_02520 [Gammaproteobacteria bacterium]|nr:hypothetical protein [Gammaproteobacteria bacterium]